LCAGLRIAFQRANLLAQFPDAFSPFKLFGCTLQEAFNGMWIKLFDQLKASLDVRWLQEAFNCVWIYLSDQL
jgi:hypothetical protein